MSKNNAVDEFLQDVQGANAGEFEHESQNPFEGQNVQEDDAGVVDDKGEKDEKVSFHNNPKLKRYIEKEIAKATANLTPRQAEQVKEKMGEETDLVAAFTNIIGNDTPEKVNALRMLGQTVENLKSEARSAKEMIEGERKAAEEAQAQLDAGVDTIENEFDVDLSSTDPVARKTRGEFMNFLKRVAPKNSQGEIIEYPDFQATFELFQESRKKVVAPSRAKELAARGMERSGDASKPQGPIDQSWRGVEKYISSLKG